jgi:hypothetical protein
MKHPFQVDLEALKKLGPEERRTVEAELAELDAAVRANPLIAYRPHPKQQQFHSPPHPRSRIFIGGNRSGKTTATLVDTIIQACDREVIPPHLLAYKRWEPPFFCRVVGPDLTRWLEFVALQKFREWCPKSQLKGAGFVHGWDKQQLVLRFRNDSMIQFMSNDQDLDKFAGPALHRMVYDEPPRQDIRGECLMRLIDYAGEELFGLTPLDGMSNWLYNDFYVPWENGSLDPHFARLVRVDMDDNPHLDAEAKEWVLSQHTDEEREARKTGRFVSFAGLVYKSFSSSHIIPEISEVPDGAECFEMIDPGIRNMCAVLFAYLTYEGDFVVYDEIASQDRTIRQVCKDIKLRRERWGQTVNGKLMPNLPRWTVIDPAARNRNSQTGRSDQAEFSDNGIPTVPGQNAVGAGINRVKERLEADRLHVAANCTVTIRQFRQYRWAKRNARAEGDPREKPLKEDDHMLDALRYGVMARPLSAERGPDPQSHSAKDRWMRAHLARLRARGAPAVQHDSGPGIFA